MVLFSKQELKSMSLEVVWLLSKETDSKLLVASVNNKYAFFKQDVLYLICLLHLVQQDNLLNALQHSWGKKKKRKRSQIVWPEFILLICKKMTKVVHLLFVLVRERLADMMGLKELYHFRFPDRGWSWAKSLHKLYLSAAFYWRYFSVVSSSKSRVLCFGSAFGLCTNLPVKKPKEIF